MRHCPLAPLTRMADSKYRLSKDDMAISFKAVSDNIPSQLRKLRNNFSALLNWRWKNDVLASWSLQNNTHRISFRIVKEKSTRMHHEALTVSGKSVWTRHFRAIASSCLKWRWTGFSCTWTSASAMDSARSFDGSTWLNWEFRLTTADPKISQSALWSWKKWINCSWWAPELSQCNVWHVGSDFAIKLFFSTCNPWQNDLLHYGWYQSNVGIVCELRFSLAWFKAILHDCFVPLHFLQHLTVPFQWIPCQYIQSNHRTNDLL